ncbi:MAG: glycosyltransferase [Armatimonadota bacterium]
MPVYNEALRLHRAIASIQSQSFQDWELVAIDDGSDDGTGLQLADAASGDSRIRVIFRDHHGIAPALNAGIAEARGEWIARMDADDLMRSDRLAVQLDYAAKHPDLAIVGSLVDLNSEMPPAPESGMARFIHWVNSLTTPELIARDIFVDCPIPHPTFFLRRSVFEDVGSYSDSGAPEDYELALRLHSLGYRFGKVPESLVAWTDWEGRASRTSENYGRDVFRALKIRFLKSHMEDRTICVWGAGSVGKRFVLGLQEQGFSVEAIIDVDPRKIRQVIHGCRVVTADEWLNGRTSDSLVLAAAGAPGAREEIRQFLTDKGLSETADFVAVA